MTDSRAKGSSVRLSPRLAGVRPYAPPVGRGSASLLLDANEGAGASEAVREIMARVDLERIRRYPDAGVLESMLAVRIGVDPERVVVTAGGDDAIHRVCTMTLDPGSQAVTHSPVFEMIPRYARLAGAEVAQVPWVRGEFPIDPFIGMIGGSTGLVAVVSPNNPTGAVMRTRELGQVAQAAWRRRAVALVDLAYAEFADLDPTPALLDLPNVVMIRTLSKAFGLAGLRVGYAVCPADLAPTLRAAGGPYPVSGLSLAVAEALVSEWDRTKPYLTLVRQQREVLMRHLRKLGADPLPSEANFVTAEFSDAMRVHEGLLARGISVRAFGSAMEQFLRITLPGEREPFEQLVESLTSVCRQIGKGDEA